MTAFAVSTLGARRIGYTRHLERLCIANGETYVELALQLACLRRSSSFKDANLQQAVAPREPGFNAQGAPQAVIAQQPYLPVIVVLRQGR